MCSSKVQRDPLRLRLSNDRCVCNGARGRPPKGAGRTVPTHGPAGEACHCPWPGESSGHCLGDGAESALDTRLQLTRDKIQLPKDQTVNKFATEQGSSQNKTQQYILIPSLNGLKHSVWNPIKNYQA